MYELPDSKIEYPLTINAILRHYSNWSIDEVVKLVDDYVPINILKAIEIELNQMRNNYYIQGSKLQHCCERNQQLRLELTNLKRGDV